MARYEHHFSESPWYRRTRFIVAHTAEAPHFAVGPSGEQLKEEKARILGTEKPAQQLRKLR